MIPRGENFQNSGNLLRLAGSLKPSRKLRSALSSVTPWKSKVAQYSLSTSTMKSFGSPRYSPRVSLSKPRVLEKPSHGVSLERVREQPNLLHVRQSLLRGLLKCSAHEISRRLTSRLRLSLCARCTPPGIDAALDPPSIAAHTSFGSDSPPEDGAVKSTSPSTRKPSTGGASALLSAIPATIAGAQALEAQQVYLAQRPGPSLRETRSSTGRRANLLGARLGPPQDRSRN